MRLPAPCAVLKHLALARHPTGVEVGPRMAYLDEQQEQRPSYGVSRDISSEAAEFTTPATHDDSTLADVPTPSSLVTRLTPVAPRVVPVLSHPLNRSSQPSPDAASGPVRGYTILIVENEDSNRILMEKILGFAGYRCMVACNGQEALDIFDRERPDMVLTDISMPVMGGFEEIASIRARPEGARVPIVAVSAHAMSGDRESALREGCDEYLVKPYRPRDLLDVVARLLKEARV